MNTSASAGAAPLARYAASRRVGDYIFLSGVIAVDPAASRIVRGYDDIPPEAAALIGRTGEFSCDIKEGPILAQSWYVLDRIRQTIEAEGGRMEDVFKLVQYFRDLDHFPLYNRVRKLFYPNQPPVSTVVGVSGLMPTDDILIEVEGTAYLPLPRPE
ncbi:RidA family protein [Ideonella sp. B7]|uniref:RidA family protein n=1 Tax=Ideonella benzenivorans TaxID=2831643 RepID=UPI001CED944F|nr:RidA family protein [Ideonella benzenivorans]MCA6217500.1 RidA family protein [Ideonella benzenivorans]